MKFGNSRFCKQNYDCFGFTHVVNLATLVGKGGRGKSEALSARQAIVNCNAASEDRSNHTEIRVDSRKLP